MTLADMLGYRLAITRYSALRSLHRHLEGSSYRPADTTALLSIRERPGCDQTALGRVLAANRSVGMKVASRLEARGLLTRGAGRDRRSIGLFLTDQGEAVLDDLLGRHQRAESRLTAHLDAGERATLITLLGKVQGALEEEEAECRRSAMSFEAAGQAPA